MTLHDPWLLFAVGLPVFLYLCWAAPTYVYLSLHPEAKPTLDEAKTVLKHGYPLPPKSDLPAALAAYEESRLSAEDTVALFAYLVRTGLLSELPDVYTRTARAFVKRGFVSEDGFVLAVPNPEK